MVLELSCPEAARIILSYGNPASVTADIPGGEEPEYDTEAMEVLLRTRETARSILSDSARPVNETLALLLMYGYQAQDELDGDDEEEFDPSAVLAEARSLARKCGADSFVNFFKHLEILTGHWRQRLDTPVPAAWDGVHLRLARYFVDRYWLQAVSDYDLVSRVKLAAISCLLIRTLGGDPVTTSQLYSKEIENSIENVEAILDGAYAAPAFTDDRLLGLFLL